MRRLFVLLLGCAVAQLQFAQLTAPPVSVPRGTGVEIELLQDVASNRLKLGQVIPFKLVRPIELNGQTVLPAGTPAAGVVEMFQNAGHWGKNTAFNLVLQPLQLADGTVLHLDFPRAVKQTEKGEKAANAAMSVLVFSYYFPLAPLVLIGSARKGKPFTIRSGERYLVYVTSSEPPPARVPTEPVQPQPPSPGPEALP